MPRRETLRTWEQVEIALEENGVRKASVARYYGLPRQVVNTVMRPARVLTLPNSQGWWKAIDDIKRGVLVEPEGE